MIEGDDDAMNAGRAAVVTPIPGRQSTVDKVVAVLQALAVSEHGIGVRELSRATGIDKSALSRLLDQLGDRGFVEQHHVSGRFIVGPRLFAIAATIHARDGLWLAAEGILMRLVERFNETCYLATKEADRISFRNKIDCTRTIRYVIELGSTSPLHAGAGGRAILAGMTEEEIEAFLAGRHLGPVTDRTVTDAQELRRQIREDRSRGYAMSIGERVVGGSAIAAPFFASRGVCLGSVVFTCPAERFDMRRAPEIADAVAQASADLSERLGYAPAPPTSAPAD